MIEPRRNNCTGGDFTHSIVYFDEKGRKMEVDKYYKELFDDKAKIAAFDELAKNFYYCNFGSMVKSDIETLMFSLYIDQILNKSEEDENSYSDYVLSKHLGIPQSRISNLKIKKELRYPYRNFDWKKSFLQIFGNARFENGKIKMYIPDANVYIEIKNAIESKGDYVDVQLNSKLLQVTPESFLDLVVEISDSEDAERIKEEIKAKLDENNKDIEFFTKESFGKQLKQNGIKIGVDILSEIIATIIPVAGSALKISLQKVIPIFIEKASNFTKKQSPKYTTQSISI